MYSLSALTCLLIGECMPVATMRELIQDDLQVHGLEFISSDNETFRVKVDDAQALKLIKQGIELFID